MPGEPVQLVRCYENAFVEEDWISRLLTPRQIVWRRDPHFEKVVPGAIYLVPGTFGLPAFPDRFLKAVAAQGDCGLCHLGDEFFRADYRHYSAFSFVLRNYRASWLDNPGVLTFPLGYPPGLLAPADVKQAADRKFLWCFLGARNASRADLVRSWAQVSRGFVSLPNTRAGDAMLPRTAYLDVMNESAFAPAPMGNVVIETWRFWEALELGVIPIAPRRRGLDYYRELLGAHPIPTFRTWDEAAIFVSRFQTDPAGLNLLQAEILNWWTAEKAKWSGRLVEHIERGQAGLFRRDLEEFETFSKSKNQIRRVSEFLQHHDIAALRGRAAIALDRLRRRAVGAGQPVRVTHPLFGRPEQTGDGW